MKLIIDIPEEDYDIIKKVDAKYEINYFKWLLANLVQNGTPLDDVKAEIANLPTYMFEVYKFKSRVLHMLNNIGKAERSESE